MKLAPHMIQSMELLQMPILALQEKIEQELNENPVLELEEPATREEPDRDERADDSEDDSEKDLVVEADSDQADGFERLSRLDDDFQELMDQSGPYRPRIDSSEPDKKLEAMHNTAAPPQSLHDHLADQWRLVDADPKVKQAGGLIIDYIDDRGYLTVRLEQLHNKDKYEFDMDDLNRALDLVQHLDPSGVGARDLRECLLIQLAQSPEDTAFEEHLIGEYLDKLLDNRLPEIARHMKCSVEEINFAIKGMSKLDTSPGLQISQSVNHPVTPDIIVEPKEDGSGYDVRLAESSLPALKINNYYAKMANKPETNKPTKKFLQNNIRSAQWIIDAIQQRRNTLLRVATSVVKHQREFFDKGQLHMKPLPMSKVADEVGVHIATVSRAVSGKYVQCSWGLIPLRKFFGGGTENSQGQAHSWHAVRAKLQQIIDEEDKAHPLSDDAIRKKLEEAGIKGLARRTVAKYRNLMNIPAARYRKKY